MVTEQKESGCRIRALSKSLSFVEIQILCIYHVLDFLKFFVFSFSYLSIFKAVVLKSVVSSMSVCLQGQILEF